MNAVARVVSVIVPCLLLLLSASPAALAASSGYPYQEGGPLQTYLSKYYNWYGNKSDQQPDQSTATTPAPAQPEPPATEPAAPTEPADSGSQATVQPAAAAAPQKASYRGGSSLQDYRNRYYGSQGRTYGSAPQPAPLPVVQPGSQPPVQPAQQTPAQPEPQPSQPAAAPAPPPASGLSAEESLMFDLVNQERTKAGLAPFRLDLRLVSLARQKSQDMYQNKYFGHNSPTYGSPYDMEKKAGINARVMGAENIAKASSVQQAHQMLMDSSGHRANILYSLHDTIGIGIVKTQSGVMVTQLFTGS